MEDRAKKINVVIDTNVLVSALLSRDGKCARILKKIIDGYFTNFTSEDILFELYNVLHRPKFLAVLSKEDIDKYLSLIRSVSVLVKTRTKINICRDLDDNKFIETAYDACAFIIVTGDPDLLVLREEGSNSLKVINKVIKILKPSEFLSEIN